MRISMAPDCFSTMHLSGPGRTGRAVLFMRSMQCLRARHEPDAGTFSWTSSSAGSAPEGLVTDLKWNWAGRMGMVLVFAHSHSRLKCTDLCHSLLWGVQAGNHILDESFGSMKDMAPREEIRGGESCPGNSTVDLKCRHHAAEKEKGLWNCLS